MLGFFGRSRTLIPVLALSMLLACETYLHAGAGLSTFEADVVRTATAVSGREEQSGRLAFDAATSRLVLELRKPIHQWVVLKGNETLLYYPESRQALRITSETVAALPFFSVVWNCFKEDFGLSAQGYRMARHQRTGTRLISVWIPPSQLSRLAGEATLEHDGARLLRVEHKTAKGNLRSRVTFAQHTTITGTAFPLEVAITYGSKDGLTHEAITLRNPRFNEPLTDAMRTFAIPAGVRVKDVQ